MHYKHVQKMCVISDIVSIGSLLSHTCFLMTPVFSLQLPDGDKRHTTPVGRRRKRVRPQQSRVHGEGAAEQRGVPARWLPGGRSPVHQRAAGRPAELHSVQQPLGGPSQTGAPPGGAWRRWQSLRAQPQVAEGQSFVLAIRWNIFLYLTQ